MALRLPHVKQKPFIDEFHLPYDSFKLRFRPDPKPDALSLPELVLPISTASSPPSLRSSAPSEGLLDTLRADGSPDLHIGHPPVSERVPLPGRVKHFLQDKRPHSRKALQKPHINEPNNTLKVDQLGILLQTTAPIPKRKDKLDTREKSSNGQLKPEESQTLAKGSNFRSAATRPNIVQSSPSTYVSSNVHLPSMNGNTEELIAMGTNWNLSSQASNKFQGNQPSSSSLMLPGSTQPLSFISPSVGALTTPIAMSQRYRQRGQHVSVRENNTKVTPSIPHVNAKYDDACGDGFADAAHNAPGEFTQRIAEFANLEAETIRWERAKKVKKKLKAEV